MCFFFNFYYGAARTLYWNEREAVAVCKSDVGFVRRCVSASISRIHQQRVLNTQPRSPWQPGVWSKETKMALPGGFCCKRELRHFAWAAPRARRREINDVLQQTSFNGAIFFPTTCITPYASVPLAILAHHTCRMSQKAQTQFINQHFLAKKFYTFNSSNLYSDRIKNHQNHFSPSANQWNEINSKCLEEFLRF
jgi:hypothetical protein